MTKSFWGLKELNERMLRPSARTLTNTLTHMQWRVLKFCSCQSSLASSRGFQSRPLYHFCSSPPWHVSNRSIESRRIFPFNICTISHICTTEFAVDSFSPLTTRFSLTFHLSFPSASALLFRPNHLMNMKNFQRVVHFLVSAGIFDYFLGRRRRELCANNCKIIKMTSRHSEGAGVWVYRCVWVWVGALGCCLLIKYKSNLVQKT